MHIDILTLFPKMFESVLGESMMKRAKAKGKVGVNIRNLRDWTFDSHRSADDKPFGGGAGMVMKVEPVFRALSELGLIDKRGLRGKGQGVRVILLTPQGKKLDQGLAKELSRKKRLVLICGHYEGVDERIRSFVDEEISIGDYVLTCGELPAMVLIDCVVRLLPGVLGSKESLLSESFEKGLLEYSQYTRPADFNGMKVPEELLGGNHKEIAGWRKADAVKRTKLRRPDLLKESAMRKKAEIKDKIEREGDGRPY